jgi:hypothetical protein
MALLFLLMAGSTEEGGNPVADAEATGRTAGTTPEKKESTHAAD